MAGRRNIGRGSAVQGINIALQARDRVASDRREFIQGLVENEIASGRASFNIGTGQITPIQQRQFDPSTLQAGQTFRQDVGGGTLTTEGQAPLLTPEEMRNRALQFQGQPGAGQQQGLRPKIQITIDERGNQKLVLTSPKQLTPEDELNQIFVDRLRLRGQQAGGAIPTPQAPSSGASVLPGGAPQSQPQFGGQFTDIQRQLGPGVSLRAGPITITQPDISPGEAQVLTSAQGQLTSLDTIESLLFDATGNVQAGRLFFAGFPGGLTKELGEAIDRLELEVVTARGGKQLTETEIKFIREVIPGQSEAIDAWLKAIFQTGDPANVIRTQLQELRKRANQIINATALGQQPGVSRPSPTRPRTVKVRIGGRLIDAEIIR